MSPSALVGAAIGAASGALPVPQPQAGAAQHELVPQAGAAQQVLVPQAGAAQQDEVEQQLLWQPQPLNMLNRPQQP